MQQRKRKSAFTTKTIAYCALFAALNVVLARLFALMPSESARFSIEAVPTFLAGVFFGPLAGGIVGFSGDFIGCLFSGYGYNPMFCVPPILYGVFGGLFRHLIAKNSGFRSLFWLIIGFLLPVTLGSILYQSFALNLIYSDGSVTQFWIRLTARSIQFSITMVLEIVITKLLLDSKIFTRMGLWPPATKK